MKSYFGYAMKDYYDDIVTERSIERLCGYAICPAPLAIIPSAKFHISIRNYSSSHLYQDKF